MQRTVADHRKLPPPRPVDRRVYEDIQQSILELQRWLRSATEHRDAPSEAELDALEVVDGRVYDAVLAVRRCDRTVR